MARLPWAQRGSVDLCDRAVPLHSTGRRLIRLRIGRRRLSGKPRKPAPDTAPVARFCPALLWLQPLPARIARAPCRGGQRSQGLGPRLRRRLPAAPVSPASRPGVSAVPGNPAVDPPTRAASWPGHPRSRCGSDRAPGWRDAPAGMGPQGRAYGCLTNSINETTALPPGFRFFTTTGKRPMAVSAGETATSSQRPG